jgi:metal-sulfur cluster biosynthetic enzyme|tara:strand:- start:356 stop:670 length:315 start_codon:yes stop_codon:yes gene_type:complete
VVTVEEVKAALEEVYDPHMNVSLLDMGMVRRVEVSDQGKVDIGLVFPCVGCPAWDLIQNDIKQTLSPMEGVTRVKVSVEWHHAWNRDDIKPEARLIAKEHGYVI